MKVVGRAYSLLKLVYFQSFYKQKAIVFHFLGHSVFKFTRENLNLPFPVCSLLLPAPWSRTACKITVTGWTNLRYQIVFYAVKMLWSIFYNTSYFQWPCDICQKQQIFNIFVSEFKNWTAYCFINSLPHGTETNH